MKKIKSKKAQMPKFVLGVAVLVISVVFLLLVYYMFFSDFREDIDKKTCRSSVISRSTFNIQSANVGNVIPLKCKTEKICLTQGSGECEDIFGPKSEENSIRVVQLSGNNEEEAKQEAIDVLSDALYDCHWMMGEGQADFLPNRVFLTNYCPICSRIGFDGSSRELLEDYNYMEFYEDLHEKKNSQGIRYLKYIYGVENPIIMNLIFNGIIKKGEGYESFKDSVLGGREISGLDEFKVITSDHSAVVVQIQEEGRWTQYAVTSVFVAGGIIAAGYSLGTVPVAAIFSGGAISFFYVTPGGSTYIPPLIIPYEPEKLRDFGCREYTNLP